MASEEAAAATRLDAATYEQLVDGLHEGVFVIAGPRMRYVNEACAAMVGGRPEEVAGLPLARLIAPEDYDLVVERYRQRLAGEDVPDIYEFSLLHLDGHTRVPVFMHTRMCQLEGRSVSLGTLVPLEWRAELERQAGETRAAQATADEEAARLAIPVLQLHEAALVIPLVGHINAARARQLMDRLLAAIREHAAREVIVDITGVPTVDARIAGYLVRAAQAARLLGACMTLAGVTPASARTLVDLDVRDLRTTASLQDAWRAASARLGRG